MINPNEFRRGNYFQWSKFASMGKGIDRITPKNHYDYEQLRDPVPVTREWLIEVGFYQEGSEAGDDGALELGDCQDKKLSILWIPKIGRYTKKDNLGLWLSQNYMQENLQIPLKKVKYRHQIQNLYHSLTGKEL